MNCGGKYASQNNWSGLGHNEVEPGTWVEGQGEKDTGLEANDVEL